MSEPEETSSSAPKPARKRRRRLSRMQSAVIGFAAGSAATATTFLTGGRQEVPAPDNKPVPVHVQPDTSEKKAQDAWETLRKKIHQETEERERESEVRRKAILQETEEYNREADKISLQLQHMIDELKIQTSLIDGDRANEEIKGDALLSDLLAKHKHIIFADTDHSSEEIPLFIASQLQNLRKAGVDAIFLELDDTANSKKLHFSVYDNDSHYSYQVIPSHAYLCRMAHEAGIRVFFMDTPVVSDAAKRGASDYFQFQSAVKNYGKDSPEAIEARGKMKGPDYTQFLKERDEANHHWVNFIAEKTNKHQLGNWVAIGGNGHLNEVDDFDELAKAHPAIGSAATVALCPLNVGSPRALPGPGHKESPDYFLGIRNFPDDFIKHIDEPLFKYLVEKGQWDTLGEDAKRRELIASMPSENYIEMAEHNEFEHAELYKVAKRDAIRGLRQAGLLAEAHDYPTESWASLNKIVPEFQKILGNLDFKDGYFGENPANNTPEAEEERTRLRRLGIEQHRYFDFEHPFKPYPQESEGVEPEGKARDQWPEMTAEEKAEWEKSKKRIAAQREEVKGIILQAQDNYLHHKLPEAIDGARRAYKICASCESTDGIIFTHAQPLTDDLARDLQIEKFQRERNYKAAKLLKAADAYDSWSSFGLQHDRASDEETKRWEKYRDMVDALSNDDPKAALTHLADLKNQMTAAADSLKQSGAFDEQAAFNIGLEKDGSFKDRHVEFDRALEAYAQQKEAQQSGKRGR